jgi:hypothetical protein
MTLLLAAPSSRADQPQPALAFLAGASVLLAGFAVGGVLLSTSKGNDTKDDAAWLTIETGFALAPLASHAVVGEWLRGLAFAAPPAAVIAGTAALFGVDPGTIEHGEIPEQRVLWSLFGFALLSSAVGVVDSAFADKHAAVRAPDMPSAPAVARPRGSVAVTPLFGSGHLGLRIGVAL